MRATVVLPVPGFPVKHRMQRKFIENIFSGFLIKLNQLHHFVYFLFYFGKTG
jgi:hypothetical protein